MQTEDPAGCAAPLPDDAPVADTADLARFLGGGAFLRGLLELCALAAAPELARLRRAFPQAVIAWTLWRRHSVAGAPLRAGQLRTLLNTQHLRGRGSNSPQWSPPRPGGGVEQLLFTHAQLLAGAEHGEHARVVAQAATRLGDVWRNPGSVFEALRSIADNASRALEAARKAEET